jgi:hypothetical protein
MNEPEKQENYSLLRFKISRILSPECNLNVESKCSTGEITQKVCFKLARFEERVGKFCQNL